MTSTKTMEPIIRSGLLDSSHTTRAPARITPKLMITSFEVKIMLAFICASSFPFDLCKRKRQIPFAIKAKMETMIIVLKFGICSTPTNLLITSIKPSIANSN